jgi:hypothetical protein
VRAALIVGAERTELGADVPTVPAGPVVLEVEDIASAVGIRLDGRPLAASYDRATRRATVSIDLGRYTGYHQLLVPPSERFLFGTDDAKLRIVGVNAMLEYLRDEGLAWQGALQFSGTDRVLRDLRLDAAWLEGNAPVIAEIAAAIAARPATTTSTTYRRAPYGVPALGRTFQLLRRDRDLLEEHPKGPVIVAGTHWAPREIVIRQREAAFDTVGNRRATRLLVLARALASAVARAMATEPAANFAFILELLDRALLLEPFRTLQRRRSYRLVPTHAAREELVDERYARVYELLRELEHGRYWTPEQDVLPDYAFATYADQIYQAFVATLVADAFALEAVKRLGGAGPHFRNDEYDLYVNTTVPSEILSNWRDDTVRPSSLRPDLVLHKRDDGRAVIADAKYRNDGDRASSDSLNEAQLYLQAFGKESAAILFPPKSLEPRWEAHHVAAGGFRLLEFPIRPAPGAREWVAGPGRDALLGLLG